MSTVVLALVAVGGVAGAIGRYLAGVALPSTVATTLSVNVTGSLVLGALVAARPGESLLLALGTGFCGAFTTFSSFAVEAIRLAETGQWRRAVAYASGMALAAVVAVVVGGWAVLWAT